MADTTTGTTTTTTTAPSASSSTSAQAVAPHTDATAAQTSTTSRPGAIENAVYDGLTPAEQSKYALVRRGPDGGSQWVHRDSLPPDTTASTTGADGAVDPKQMAPGSKVKIAGADGKVFELGADDIAMLMEQKASADLRKATVPADPSAYEIKLPASLKLPEGIEFKADPTDPAYADMRAWAHRRGLTQDDFAEALGIYASKVGREEATFRAAAAAEIEKMGANATMRVTAIETFLRGHVGDELATPMRSMIVSEKIARGFERLIAKFASQGAASFRQDFRVPSEGGPGRVDEATFEKMPAGERLDYARQFDQKQFQNGRR